MLGPAAALAGQRDQGAAAASTAQSEHELHSYAELWTSRAGPAAEPYDLPFPDHWPHRPTYVIVVDQLRDWRPGQPPSRAELLEAGLARTREPEPDLEAEP
jgi:hypothetical protein